MADALGRPLAFHLTVGEAVDCKAYDALINLPECAPDALLADKGYDADAIRADLVERKITAVIPGMVHITTAARDESVLQDLAGTLGIAHANVDD